MLVGVLSAEESRETRPGGWEGRGIGQPLSTLTLSACGTSPTSWGVGPLPIVRTIMSPDGAWCPLGPGVGVPWAEDPASRRGGFVSTVVLRQAAGRLLEGRTGAGGRSDVGPAGWRRGPLLPSGRGRRPAGPPGGDVSPGRRRRRPSAATLGDHLSPESRTCTSPTGTRVTPSPRGTPPIHHSQHLGLQVPPPAPACSAAQAWEPRGRGLPVWGQDGPRRIWAG